MKTIKRALRSILRSPLRTGLLVAVLAVSVGLTLIMITVNAAFSERLDEIKGEVGTSVTVRPAGSFGGGFFRGAFQGQGADEGGGFDNTLTDEAIDEVWSIENVVGVSRSITVPYLGEGLASAPLQLPEGFAPPEGFGQFTRPVLVTGTDNPNSLTTFGGADPELVAGRTFNDDEAEANVAVIGATLAEGNGLAVGDTFEMEGASSIEVVGIFTTGTQFGDNSFFLPLKTAQEVFDREGEIDQAVVQADSVDHVEQVADDVRELLGEDAVDVSTELSAFAAINAPLSDAKSSSQVGMIAALIASAAVILFSVGLVARQRVKEIGILKSIGASNWHITAQFGIETAALSVVAALIGALATFPLAQTVANGLVSDPAGPGGFGGGPGGPGGGGQFGGFRGFGGFEGFGGAGGFLGDVDVAVSPEVFLYALGIALVLAVVASIIPAWYTGQVKPAEVLRYE
jgi:ABC-type antimicrobial peptide transport system permease subunit